MCPKMISAFFCPAVIASAAYSTVSHSAPRRSLARRHPGAAPGDADRNPPRRHQHDPRYAKARIPNDAGAWSRHAPPERRRKLCQRALEFDTRIHCPDSGTAPTRVCETDSSPSAQGSADASDRACARSPSGAHG
jgi:hypothetical protein